MFEYENKNFLSGDNKSRAEAKTDLLCEALRELETDGAPMSKILTRLQMPILGNIRGKIC
jgi:hypothetical protein